MENESYILITGWMVNELELKGSELFVYALIYGFSQDGESKFYGSRRYIAEWFNCSLPTIDKALNGLLEKNYIIKEPETINGVTFNRYRYNKEILGGIKKLYRGYKETLYNNTNNNKDKKNNIINNITKKEFQKPTLEEIETYVKDKNLNVDPKEFYNYFEEGNWKDSKGNKVKNWKQKILTWNKFNSSKKETKVIPSWFNKSYYSSESSKEEKKEFENFIKGFRNE